MAEELIDLVDQNNHPLGATKERSAVHRDGDWHRTVHIYFVNKKDDFLVHLRSPLKDLSPSKWDARFGGHVITGKTQEETVHGELKDELGVNLEPSQLIEGNTYQEANGKNNEFTKVYYYQFNKDLSSLTFDDREVREVRWTSPHEIQRELRKNPSQWAGNLHIFQKIYRDYQKLQE